MQAQSITLATGIIVPATCDQQTDLALLPICVDAYHTLTGGSVSLDTIRKVMEAMRDASAVIALYTDGKCETAARCLWPASVSVTKDQHLVSRAYCTLRREWHTFRLDRMVAVHLLTTPDDAEPREEATPALDPAKVAVRLGQALEQIAERLPQEYHAVMKAYSPDLRQRIVAAVQAGDRKAAVARRFCVERSTVRRYVQRWERTGSLAATPIPGAPPAIAPTQYPALLAQLRAMPDATLEAHCDRWERDHGVRVSLSTMSRAQRRAGWTRKKRA
jgi:transposase